MIRQTARWECQFRDFSNALDQVKCFIDKGIALNPLEKQGMIQAFEYTFEMAWKTMKHYHESSGSNKLKSPREAIMFAASSEMIEEENCWFNMLSDRNKTAHNYNSLMANRIFEKIRHVYYPELLRFRTMMAPIYNRLQPLINNN